MKKKRKKQNSPNHGFQWYLSGKAKQSENTVFVWESDGKFFFSNIEHFCTTLSY